MRAEPHFFQNRLLFSGLNKTEPELLGGALLRLDFQPKPLLDRQSTASDVQRDELPGRFISKDRLRRADVCVLLCFRFARSVVLPASGKLN